MQNTGKPAEHDFEAYWASLGKLAHVERLVDASEVVGRTGRRGFTRKQPSDYVVTHKGVTFYAEVKSTIDPKVMKPSLLKTGQRSAATRITAAGGLYVIYLKSIALNQWFCIPFADFPSNQLAWSQLQNFKWLI